VISSLFHLHIFGSATQRILTVFTSSRHNWQALFKRIGSGSRLSYDDGSSLLFCHGATKFSGKSEHACHGVGLQILLLKGKSLGPQGNTGWQTPDFLSW